MFKIDYYCFSVAHLIGARSFSTFKSLFLYSSASVSHFLPLVVMSTFSHCSTNLCHAIFIYFSRSNAPLSHPHVITHPFDFNCEHKITSFSRSILYSWIIVYTHSSLAAHQRGEKSDFNRNRFAQFRKRVCCVCTQFSVII